MAVALSRGSPSRMALGARDEPLDDLVVNRVVHQDARPGRAHLARVEEDPGRRRLDGRIEVGSGENDVGGFAAELQRHALEVAGGGAQDLASDRGRAGKGHLVHAGVLDQRRTGGLSEAGHDIQHARRNAGSQRQLAELERRERGELRRLQDHRAAAGERRRDLPHADHERKIPRYDGAHDADGLAQV